MDGINDIKSRLGSKRTIAALLAASEDILSNGGIDGADLEASFLLGHILGRSRASLFVDAAEDVSPDDIDCLLDYIKRRLDHQPLAYILGEWEFWSLSLHVSPAVLIPRKETEVLVEKALYALNKQGREARAALTVLDMGTGSGALAVALAMELPGATIVALDRSAAALRVASANIARYHLADRIHLVQSDWAACIAARHHFDLIVSNPPYIEKKVLGIDPDTPAGAEAELLQPEVRCSEPILALDGGRDGFDQVRRFVDSLLFLLKPEGLFFMEIGSGQEGAILRLFQERTGFGGLSVHRDYAGLPRVLQAARSCLSGHYASK